MTAHYDIRTPQQGSGQHVRNESAVMHGAAARTGTPEL